MTVAQIVSAIVDVLTVTKSFIAGVKAAPDVSPVIASIEDLVLKDVSEIEQVVSDAENGQLATLGTISVDGQVFYLAIFSKSGQVAQQYGLA